MNKNVDENLKQGPQSLAIRMGVSTLLPTLITGPTGVGKTRMAQEIHRLSARQSKPFVAVHAAALPESLLETELFGCEKGAFTGADRPRIGRLEAANGGTILLDEIGELPLRLQVKLLEFIQHRKISPIGGNRQVQLDVKVIAATHQDLEKKVAAGEFREDLWHRLRGVWIKLSSISERGHEFDALVHQVLEEVCTRHEKQILSIDDTVARALEAYSWPGNFRELEHTIEFAVLACEGSHIEFRHLPAWLPLGAACAKTTTDPLNYEEQVSAFEKSFLKNALAQCGGGLSATARRVGLDKATLLRKLRRHALWQPKIEESPVVWMVAEP